ncbi:hypothetical protein F5X68DRAFT_245850 [Plectosphaerella plurivora]|uniref:Uncharacterized protein n=1 Tax=Plectosphaerella plurivora TaxID=936078 RepID=A0A9P8V372_9PEZI|nr:hypothetical protein F5X68DRAFT_245850 [Plectosphaerella plurivora]
MGGSTSSVPQRDIPDLSGKVVLITGGNTGLGLETILQLSKHNPVHIYLAAGLEAKAKDAIAQVQDKVPRAPPISFIPLDLGSFLSIKAAAATFRVSSDRLDVLINNAGIMATPEGLTEEGYEVQFGTNHMGPALRTNLLLPTLKATAARHSPDVRVIFLAVVHYNEAFAKHNPEIKSISLHPGVVSTGLNNTFSNNNNFLLVGVVNLILKLTSVSVERSALNTLWAATSADVKTGEFYHPVGVSGEGHRPTKNVENRDQLPKWTQKELASHL